MSEPRRPDGPPGVGARLGPYVIEGLLGRGGMGAVYRARHVESGAVHAVKAVLTSRLESPRALERFRREVEVLARLHGDPHVVAVHACAEPGARPWVAMDLVEGTPLSELLAREGPRPPRAAAELLVVLARAMARVHELGVVHRDLKPENVIIDARDGAPRIVDFGLAYDAFAEELTRTGECLGTPAFMAPEQVSRKSGSDSDGEGDGEGSSGAPVEPVADVYGLGGILYACLTGRPPFEGADAIRVLLDVMKRPPAPPSRVRPGVPADLDAVCLRCLEKDPDDRYPSPTALADDLERSLRGESVEAIRGALGRRARRTAALLAAVAAIAIAIAVAVGTRGTRERAAAERLDAVAATLAREGRLDEGARAELDAVRASLAGSVSLDLMHREALISDLASAISTESASSRAAATRVAEAIREGGLDPAELRFVVSTLRAAKRPDLLGIVLWEVEPIAAVPFDEVEYLARSVASPDGAPPPIDAATLATLLRAPGLEDADRGAILLRRAARHGAAGRPDGAIDDVLRAFRDHGATPDGDRWEPLFRRRLVLRFLAAVEDAPAEARDLAAIITRAGGSADPIEPDLLAVLQQASGAGSILEGAAATDAADPARVLLVGSVIVAHRGWPFVPNKGYGLRSSLTAEGLMELTRQELDLDPRRRNPGRLVMLANLVRVFPGGELDRALADGRRPVLLSLCEAAAEAAAGTEWIHLEVAYVYEDNWPELAGRHLDRALQLDRRRPDVERTVAIPVMRANVAHRTAGKDDPLAAARAVSSFALEGARLQGAIRPRVQAITDAGAFAPWVSSRFRAVSNTLEWSVTRYVGLEPPLCCGMTAEADRPEAAVTTDELIEAGLFMVDAPLALATRSMDPGPTDPSAAVFHRLRARHHLDHDRIEEALSALDLAVEDEVKMARPIPSFAAQRRTRIAKLHDRRAALLDRLGRTEDAAAARAAAGKARGD